MKQLQLSLLWLLVAIAAAAAPTKKPVFNAGNTLTAYIKYPAAMPPRLLCQLPEPPVKRFLAARYFLDTCCKDVSIQTALTAEIILNPQNNLVLPLQLSVLSKPVKEIKAELVYFAYIPESEDCFVCNRDSKTYGNFVTGTINSVLMSIANPHTAQWNSLLAAGQQVANWPLQFEISVPPAMNCCNAAIQWCIEYVITFTDCTVCTKRICYSFAKNGCIIR
jgi:hypothetical protein